MKIAIGSTNQAKIQAVQNVFSGSTFIECNVTSDVSEQPFSDEETITGAINRAKKALLEVGADIGIGLEGGVTETNSGLMLCNWGALIIAECIDEPIIAGGARILLPNEVSDRLRKGEELGPVMDDFSQRKNIRNHEGAIGIFTNGYINRVQMFTQLVYLLRGQLDYQQTITEN